MLDSIDGLVAEHAALQVELADSAIHSIRRAPRNSIAAIRN